MTFTLGPRDVHVRYLLTDSVSDDVHAQALQMLSPDECARAGRFVSSRDRVAFVAAHALLRRALSDHEDLPPDAWTFAQNAHGKPILADRHGGITIGFNLAHTHGLVACVLSRDTDVGIDVESLDHRTDALGLATRYFSPAEVADLHACAEGERAVRFIELWTLKESYVKAIGEGLSHPLNTFGFALGSPAILRFEPPAHDDQRAWQFALFAPSVGHRMAVAVHCAAKATHRITTRADGTGESAPLLRASVHDASAGVLAG